MVAVVSVNAQMLIKRPWWRFWAKQNATPKSTQKGGTHRSTYENFKSMRLLKRRRLVDAEGRWWIIETRQDLATGLIIRRTERITD